MKHSEIIADNWNKGADAVERGIGTEFIRMLVAFAFEREHVDVLHEVVYDYNTRSRRAFEGNGFRLVFSEPSVEAPTKAKEDHHLRLTREEYGDAGIFQLGSNHNRPQHMCRE